MSEYSSRIIVALIAVSVAACSHDSNNKKKSQQASVTAPAAEGTPGTEIDTTKVGESAFGSASRRVMTPLVHTGLLDHERYTYNYQPGFDPNPISFDRFNRPYMIRSDGRLQKMSSTGRWRTVDIASQVRRSLGDLGMTWEVDDPFNFTRQAQNTIVFDNSDNMYMLYDTSRNVFSRVGSTDNFARGLLLHS
jgi:hypothetical protein